MENPPNAKASYCSAHFLLTSNPHCTPQTQAALYALSSRTLAAQTNWVEDTLKLLFRRGLNLDTDTEYSRNWPVEKRGGVWVNSLSLHPDRQSDPFSTLHSDLVPLHARNYNHGRSHAVGIHSHNGRRTGTLHAESTMPLLQSSWTLLPGPSIDWFSIKH